MTHVVAIGRTRQLTLILCELPETWQSFVYRCLFRRTKGTQLACIQLIVRRIDADSQELTKIAFCCFIHTDILSKLVKKL